MPSVVVVKSESERLAPEGSAPEIVIKVEETKGEDLKVEGRIGDLVAQEGDDFDEEDEGFSYDEDSEITYSDEEEEEEEDDGVDDVKPQVILIQNYGRRVSHWSLLSSQNVDYLEFIDPTPKKVSRRVAKKRGRRGRRTKNDSGRVPCDVCGRTFAESMPLALQVHKFKEHLINR